MSPPGRTVVKPIVHWDSEDSQEEFPAPWEVMLGATETAEQDSLLQRKSARRCVKQRPSYDIFESSDSDAEPVSGSATHRRKSSRDSGETHALRLFCVCEEAIFFFLQVPPSGEPMCGHPASVLGPRGQVWLPSPHTCCKSHTSPVVAALTLDSDSLGRKSSCSVTRDKDPLLTLLGIGISWVGKRCSFDLLFSPPFIPDLLPMDSEEQSRPRRTPLQPVVQLKARKRPEKVRPQQGRGRILS